MLRKSTLSLCLPIVFAMAFGCSSDDKPAATGSTAKDTNKEVARGNQRASSSDLPLPGSAHRDNNPLPNPLDNTPLPNPLDNEPLPNPLDNEPLPNPLDNAALPNPLDNGNGNRAASGTGVVEIGSPKIWSADLDNDYTNSRIVFSPDGRWLVTVSYEGMIVFDSAAGTVKHKLNDCGGAAAVFLPDGKTAVVGRGSNLKWVNVETGKEDSHSYEEWHSVSPLQSGFHYLPVANVLTAYSGDDKGIVFLDPQDGSLKKTVNFKDDTLRDFAVDKEGKTIVACLMPDIADMKHVVIDVETGNIRHTLAENHQVHGLAAISPMEPIAAVFGGSYVDHPVIFYDILTGKELRRVDIAGYMQDLIYDASGKWLIGMVGASSDNSEVFIYDAATGRLRAKLLEGSQLQTIAISPDGKQVAAVKDNGDVCVWDTAAITAK